jgi:hypothetical protein
MSRQIRQQFIERKVIIFIQQLGNPGNIQQIRELDKRFGIDEK